MAAFSKFYTLATVRNTASAVVAVAVIWTLARKATANQRRRFLGLSFFALNNILQWDDLLHLICASQ